MSQFLKPGDGIGLIAPAGYIEPEEIQAGVEILKAEGFRVKMARHLFGRHRYFSGTISQRIKDIRRFLYNPKIKALYAVRGGSGSGQLLPYIEYKKWKKSGKMLIGFSDITALQLALWYKSDIFSFSGMTLTFQFRENNPFLSLFIKHLLNQRKSITQNDLRKENIIIARHGAARGYLMGGTLSIITSLLGTPYFPKPKRDIILFIEEVNEPPYRIERSIVQMKLAGIFQRARAIIFGRFKLEDRFVDIWSGIKYHFPDNIPVILNFPYGHFPEACALPIGLWAELQTNPFKLSW
jgi:muramoyltetrapeptide carboxypeptidase